jgi:hemoglobin
MTRFTKLAIGSTLLVLAAGCAQTGGMSTAKLKDGELAVPADYRSWPKFLVDIQRPDAKQIRDIYINPLGHATKSGDAFPNGTVSVMELYKARENPDGTLMKGADGKLVKGDLAKVFVMGKGAGWGGGVTPAELKNGDWIYSAFKADAKTPSGDEIAPCRACHLPLASKDFVHRYDEYFEKRATASGYGSR